jgi:selenocysteine lyase/cysteine desulfurase
LNLLRNVKMFVDGAHVLGQLAIDLKDLDPDYYISNGHKWLCSSHGSAFLYVRKPLQSEIHPPVQSHFYGLGFQKEFHFTGTRDYSNMFTLVAAIDFRNLLGDEKVRKYNNELCQNAGNMLMKRWNTTGVVPGSMTASLMNIRLPCSTSDPKCWRWSAEELQKKLENSFNIWVNGFVFNFLDFFERS